MPDAPKLADIQRRPGCLRLLALCGIVGVPVSAAAFGFLALEHQLTDVVWEDLPDAVGFDEVPWWWGIPSLIVGGVLVSLVATRLPGLGQTPAIAIAMAGLAVSMLRMPVASIVLVAILLGDAALAAMPVVILATVTAFVVTELIDPPSSPA